MTVSLVYVHPRIHQRIYIPAAKRFVQSYMNFPSGGVPHDINVVVNGDFPNKSDERTFSPLPVKFMHHDNFGKDIGAFQMAAKNLTSDLIVCIGSNVHFRMGGWLDIMVNAIEKNGPGIYGAYCFHQPAVHVRTTCFWMPRELLNMYPHQISNESRYDFEHGPNSIAKWCIDVGFNAWMTTTTEVLPPDKWRHAENHEALILDQHSDRIGYK